MNRKTITLAVGGTIVLGVITLGGFAGYNYFQDCLWDKEYLRVIRDLLEPEQAKEYERLLLTAKADKKPHIRNLLGSYYLGVKDYSKARAHYTKAEEEYRQLGDVGGQINTLNSLSSTSLATIEPEESEKYLSQALKLLGDNDEVRAGTMPFYGVKFLSSMPSTSKSRIVSSLASIKDKNGHPAEAEALYKQAILAKSTFERVSAYCDYADFLTRQKRPKEATAILKTAEDSIEVQKPGKGEFDDGVLALSSLASHYEFAGDFSQALRIYKKCAKRSAQMKGDNSDEHIGHLAQVAHCYEKMGQEKNEQEALEEAYRLANEPDANQGVFKKLSTRLQHWCIIHAAGPLGDFHFRKKNYAKAESLYRESIAQLAAHEKDVPVYLQGFDWTKADLAACLAAEGKKDEAESLYRDAVQALKSDTRIGPPTRFKVFNGYALFLHSSGKDRESAEFARKAQAVKAGAF